MYQKVKKFFSRLSFSWSLPFFFIKIFNNMETIYLKKIIDLLFLLLLQTPDIWYIYNETSKSIILSSINDLIL